MLTRKSIATPLWARAIRAVGRLARNCSGGTAVLTALAIVPLVGFTGLAVDATRGYMLRSQLGYALDAAGLAGGRDIFSDNLQGTVESFFRANFPDGYMDASLTGPQLVVGNNSETLTVSASATIPTTFMRILGNEEMTVSATTTVNREVKGLELTLVMDNTGSMASSNKIGTMKNAAADLVNILFGDNETVEDLWVSVVPFTVGVNMGNNNVDWLEGLDVSEFAGTEWKGCVEARPDGEDQTDTPPNLVPFVRYMNPASFTNDYPPINETPTGFGPNRTCGPAITPLTDSKTTVLAAIDEMAAHSGGGTTANLGLVWGWRSISPVWRGLWGLDTPANMPLDYDEPLMEKAVVILTDGVNQLVNNHYGAYGYRSEGRLGSTSFSGTQAELNSRMATICNSMKAEGIKIYTITFQLSDTTTQDLFRNCATDPDQYFDSPDNETLSTVFKQIANELSNLRISQ